VGFPQREFTHECPKCGLFTSKEREQAVCACGRVGKRKFVDVPATTFHPTKGKK